MPLRIHILTPQQILLMCTCLCPNTRWQLSGAGVLSAKRVHAACGGGQHRCIPCAAPVRRGVWRRHPQIQVLAHADSGSAHSTLGVAPGASKDTIKRAYRKLVLRTHPDTAHDGGSHERFIQIQEAYESLIKRRGQPKAETPAGKDSWDFHDWHWRFRMERAWAAQRHKPGEVNPYSSSERLQPLHREQVKQQLNALRRKAAYRATKRAASPAAAAPPVDCNGPPIGPDALRQAQQEPQPAGPGHRAAGQHSPWTEGGAAAGRGAGGWQEPAAHGVHRRTGVAAHSGSGAAAHVNWVSDAEGGSAAPDAAQHVADERQQQMDAAQPERGHLGGDDPHDAVSSHAPDGDSHSRGDEGQGSDGGLRWSAGDRVRSQLAGLRRKQRLRR